MIAELVADFAGLFLNASSHPEHPCESFYTSPEHLLMQEARDQVRQVYIGCGLAQWGKFRCQGRNERGSSAYLVILPNSDGLP